MPQCWMQWRACIMIRRCTSVQRLCAKPSAVRALTAASSATTQCVSKMARWCAPTITPRPVSITPSSSALPPPRPILNYGSAWPPNSARYARRMTNTPMSLKQMPCSAIICVWSCSLRTGSEHSHSTNLSISTFPWRRRPAPSGKI